MFFVFLGISAIASWLSWQNRDPTSRWIAFFLWSIPLLTLISVLALQHTRYSLSTGDLELRRTIVPLGRRGKTPLSRVFAGLRC